MCGRSFSCHAVLRYCRRPLVSLAVKVWSERPSMADVEWACPVLTDIQDQGTWGLREDVHHHGEHGEEAARPRRSFTPEFKAEIVGLCQRGDRTVRQVSQDF